MRRLPTAFLIAATLFASIAPPAWAVDGRTRREVKRRVEAAQPEARWATREIEELDIDCDGNADFAIGGLGNGVYHVAVVMGPVNRTSGAFLVGVPTGREGEVICDSDPRIVVQSSDYNPAELLGGEVPEGFQRSETCLELAVGLECMKFHIYWNHSSSRLAIWK